jgi:hypothetical protein
MLHRNFVGVMMSLKGQFPPPTCMISGGGTCFDSGPAVRRIVSPLASRPAARGYQPVSSTRYTDAR